MLAASMSATADDCSPGFRRDRLAQYLSHERLVPGVVERQWLRVQPHALVHVVIQARLVAETSWNSTSEWSKCTQALETRSVDESA